MNIYSFLSSLLRLVRVVKHWPTGFPEKLWMLQAGWGLEQHEIAEDVPDNGRGLKQYNLKVPSNPIHSEIP